MLELARLLADPIFRAQSDVARGNGRPVVLLPGFLVGDPTLAAMAAWLGRLGYAPYVCGFVANVGLRPGAPARRAPRRRAPSASGPARRFVDEEVLPVINDYSERAELPWPLFRRLAELGLVGEDIEGYGCPAMSPLACGFVHMEVNRGDGSLGTFLGIQGGWR